MKPKREPIPKERAKVIIDFRYTADAEDLQVAEILDKMRESGEAKVINATSISGS